MNVVSLFKMAKGVVNGKILGAEKSISKLGNLLNKKLDKIIGCDIKSFRFSLYPPDGKKNEPSSHETFFYYSFRKEVVLQSFKAFLSIHTFHLV